ncbi:hypothetical protein V8E36_004492 [Tilletia maclaganii]
MHSTLRIVAVPSSDSPSNSFPVLSLNFDQARYIFNCPEGTQRSCIQQRAAYTHVRSVFLTSTASAASAGLPGFLLTLANGGHRKSIVNGPLGTRHMIATMRSYVRRFDFRLTVKEVDPRPPLGVVESSAAAAADGSGSDKGKGKGKAADIDDDAAVNGVAGNSPQSHDDVLYRDEYISVQELQMLPDGYKIPPRAPNKDVEGLHQLKHEQGTSTDYEDPDESAGQDRKRSKTSHQPVSQQSLFDLPYRSTFFVPRYVLNPGSQHAEEWVTAVLSNMFSDSAIAERSQAESDQALQIFATSRQLCGPPLEPSMVNMSASSLVAPGSLPTFTPQATPPLLLSYIVKAHEQRGKFDPERASNEYGVMPGYLFSLLASGKTIQIERPKMWSEWTVETRKAWMAFRRNKSYAAKFPNRKKKEINHVAPSPYDFENLESEQVDVHPEDVLGTPRPGPILLVLTVPSPAYIDSLFSPENHRRLAGLFATKDSAALTIVHTGPPQVLLDERYIKLISDLVGAPSEPNSPQESLRDVRHIVANAAYCVDQLGFPSANLVHLRCSRLDDKIFQVPDYQLSGALSLDSLFDSKEAEHQSWPASWRSQTHVGSAQIMFPLISGIGRERAVTQVPNVPQWNFYVGPRKEAQTEEDRKQAELLASYETALVPTKNAFAIANGDQTADDKDGAPRSPKKKGKANAPSKPVRASHEVQDERAPSPARSRPSSIADSVAAKAERLATAAANAEARKQHAHELKQKTWHKFLSLADEIKEQIRAEEKSGFAGMAESESGAQWKRLVVEGQGVTLTALGTGSAAPSKYRNVSATLVQFLRPPGVPDSEPAPCVLLDAGEGTYGQLLRKFGKDKVDEILLGLKLIFISHSHADHHIGTSRILLERRNLAHRARHPLFVLANLAVRWYLEDYDLCEPLGLAESTLGYLDWQHDNERRFRDFIPLIPIEDAEVSDIDVRNSNQTFIIDTESLKQECSVAQGLAGYEAWLQESVRGQKLQWRGKDGKLLPNEDASPQLSKAVSFHEDRKAIRIYQPSTMTEKDQLLYALRTLPYRMATAKLLPFLLESLHLESCETVAVEHGLRHCYGIVLRQKAFPSAPMTAPNSSQPLAAQRNSHEGLQPTTATEATPTADASRPGFSLSYSGDTRPCEAFVQASKDVTVMIHEATIEDGRETMAYRKHHSTFSQALDVGRRAGAAGMLLTHFSQRYPKLPRLTRKWQGERECGPNMKFSAPSPVRDTQGEADDDAEGADEAFLANAEAEMDDDAILNSLDESFRSSVSKVNNGQDTAGTSSTTPAPSDTPAQDNKGMIVAPAFDLASIEVPDMWKMERYVPALELLFDADEEEMGGPDADGGGHDDDEEVAAQPEILA